MKIILYAKIGNIAPGAAWPPLARSSCRALSHHGGISRASSLARRIMAASVAWPRQHRGSGPLAISAAPSIWLVACGHASAIIKASWHHQRMLREAHHSREISCFNGMASRLNLAVNNRRNGLFVFIASRLRAMLNSSYKAHAKLGGGACRASSSSLA